MNEFDLIRTFFDRPTRRADLGIGDDCALLSPSPGMQWAVSTDMLVQGRHFFADVDPFALGHKALAVNLSDLAAMGAKPVAFTLALALPHIDKPWLQAFSQGLLALADTHGCELVGGDTTAGPLNISITVMGEVPQGQALTRSGARVGDDIYVSGHLGWARLGLAYLKGDLQLPPPLAQRAVQALERPQPQLALGLALRGRASACIDLSDGLSGDLSHILRRSGVGAIVDEAALARTMSNTFDEALAWPVAEKAQWVLAGGDDYALCFTAPVHARPHLDSLLSKDNTASPQRIGQIQYGCCMQLRSSEGRLHDVRPDSFTHF